MPLAGETIRAWPDAITSENATDETTAPGTTFVAPANGAGHSFVAPPSGRVLIIVSDRLELQTADTSQDQLFASVRLGTGATVGAGTEIEAASTNQALALIIQGVSGLRIGVSASHEHLVTGLTAGDTYNVQYQWRDNGSPAFAASRGRTVTTVPQP